MHFAFYPLQFRFLAKERVRFPTGLAANTLRGAFGCTFRRLASAQDYARIFEPRAHNGEGPSGLADWPRPFVFRAADLDGRVVSPGEEFHFGLNVFDVRNPALDLYVETFREMALEGIGIGRGRAELLDAAGRSPTFLSLLPPLESVASIRVQFVTPTELKSGDGLVESPEFAALFARARDRVSMLGALYGEGPLPVDFAELGRLATHVRMTHCEIHAANATRRSTRTGQVHSLSGFVGEAAYEGELAPFVPYLRAAAITGVGRQTTWGKGEIAVYSV